MRMESVECVYVDGECLREGERLLRNGSKLETERLEKQIACQHVPHIYKEHPIYPFDDARADPSDGALDSLVARRAHHQSAARINRRQQRVAILQAMLEVLTGL